MTLKKPSRSGILVNTLLIAGGLAALYFGGRAISSYQSSSKQDKNGISQMDNKDSLSDGTTQKPQTSIDDMLGLSFPLEDNPLLINAQSLVAPGQTPNPRDLTSIITYSIKPDYSYAFFRLFSSLEVSIPELEEKPLTGFITDNPVPNEITTLKYGPFTFPAKVTIYIRGVTQDGRTIDPIYQGELSQIR